MGPPVFPLVELPQLHGGLVRFQHAGPFMQSHSMMESQKNGDRWKMNLGSHVGFNLSFCPVSQRAFQPLLTPRWLEEVSKEALLTFCLSHLHPIRVTITIVAWDCLYLLCISFAQKHATALLSHQGSSPSSDFFTTFLTWLPAPRSLPISSLPSHLTNQPSVPMSVCMWSLLLAMPFSSSTPSKSYNSSDSAQFHAPYRISAWFSFCVWCPPSII